MNAVQYWAAGPQNSKTPKKRGLAEVQKNEEVQVDDLEISRFASELSVTALEAISHSNFKEAEAVISRIKKRIQATKKQMNQETPGGTGCHSATHLYSNDSPKSVINARIIALQLEATIQLKKKNLNRAIALAKESIQLFEPLPFEDGAAMPPKPPYEFLGDLYSQSGRYQEAMNQYQISLRKTQPHRSLTLLGLAQAANRAGDTETCRSALSELKKNWESADTEVKHGLDSLQCGQN